MAAEGESRQPEIIIVRRGGDDEDEGHHGGVWKIAFADFMTAMMCFFLVMWLINAASEETRTALASYFNPVKLIDRNTNRKGLEEVGHGPQSTIDPDEAENVLDGSAGNRDKSSGPLNYRNAAELSDSPKYSDESFFSDPYAVLAEIAAEVGSAQNISQKGEGGEQNAGPSSGASGGEAYRDPFAPDFWSQQVATPQIGVEGDPDEAREHPAGADTRAAETGTYNLSAAEATPQADRGGPALAPGTPPAEAAVAIAPAPEAVPLAEQTANENIDAEAAEARRREAADAMREALAEALEGERIATAVTVTAGTEGVLISITDDLREGMFTVGSAVPAHLLVRAMEKIGRILAGQPGNVRIHGHTDGRPFAGDGYDNWRLSTARAHAAHYMLVRGGLDEARIEEVAGFADRRLKMPDNPLADANRRIEILLETPR